MGTSVAAITVEADLHCHILPAWDDGPKTFEESLEMAGRAAQAGIKQILVTPHVARSVSSRPERPARDIPGAAAELEQEFKAHGVEIGLVPAAEVPISTTDLLERLAAEPWLTVGGQGRYVLLESTFGTWPVFADQMLYQVSMLGITTIIAHPERYSNVQQDPMMLAKAVDHGALLQITARSLTGDDGRRTKQCSRRLMEAGLAALVASDAHNARGILPGEVEAEVRAMVGESAAHQILVENPRRVLAGEPAYPPERESCQPGRGRFWSLGQIFSRRN